jgi:hypothetical protein
LPPNWKKEAFLYTQVRQEICDKKNEKVGNFTNGGGAGWGQARIVWTNRAHHRRLLPVSPDHLFRC